MHLHSAHAACRCATDDGQGDGLHRCCTADAFTNGCCVCKPSAATLLADVAEPIDLTRDSSASPDDEGAGAHSGGGDGGAHHGSGDGGNCDGADDGNVHSADSSNGGGGSNDGAGDGPAAASGAAVAAAAAAAAAAAVEMD